MTRHPASPASASSPGSPATSGGRALLLAVRFATELAMLLALAVVGARLAAGLPMRIAFALLLPAVAAVVWGRFVAPRAARRLADPARLAVELALFVVSAAGLALVGYGLAGLVHGVAAVVIAVLVRRWGTGG